jgi:peptidoglycan hydrolase CwlO-like protein
MALTVAILAGVAAVLTFTRFGSYSRTIISEIKQSAKEQVPVELEIKRLKDEVSRLGPDLRKNLSVVADQMASVERLEKEIATTQTNLERQKAVLLKMATDLETPETTFIYESKAYNRDQVARKMDLDWKSYKIAQTELRNKEQFLELKRRELENAKAKLDSVRDQERSLRLEIAELEAEFSSVNLMKAKNRFVVDDSRLGDVKQSIEELRFRLEKEKKLAGLEAEYFGNEVVGSDRPVVRPATEVAREIREQLEGAKVADKK